MNTAESTLAQKPLVKFAFALARIVYPVSRWLSSVSILAAAAMMLLIAADVFMRRAFNSPIFGSYDVIKVLLVIIVFCAVAHVMRGREHVVVDSITRLYPHRFRRAVTGISQFLSMFILALICWQTVNYGLAMFRVGEDLVLLRIPMSPFVFIVALGYAIFFLVVMVQFIFTLAGVDENTEQLMFPAERDHGQR